ncbi:MAG: TetR/AcrR family transcriptional regulator [Clostridiales bacterium]|nr:TetR/AcrR family transcriptional regulator [Clostridiales bacterium]
MNGFERRTKENKERVLKSAFELMNASADGNITIDDVVKHSNVGKTTIFKYFGSKDNLIHEVYKYILDDLIKKAEEVMDESKSFEDILSTLAQNKIDFLSKINSNFYSKMMKYITQKDEDGLSLVMEKYAQNNYNMMLDFFHRGRKEGKIDLKYSDEFLLLYFQAFVEGLSNPKIYEKAKYYTEEWTEMLIKGIAPNNVFGDRIF